MTTPSHMPKHYEFVVKKPHKAAARIAELEAQLAELKSISLNSALSWQDKHIAAFKILNPELLQERGE